MAEEINPIITTENDASNGETPAAPHSQTGAADVPENETEYERIQRLKLNTDDAPHSGAIGDDIAKILKDVKLPDRQAFHAQADRTIVNAAAALSGISLSEKGAVEKPAPEVPHEGPAAAQTRDPVTALHTLKDDLQNVVRTNKISLVRASALEQNKKRIDKNSAPINPAAAQRARRTFTFVFFALLLIVLGSAALFGVFLVMQNKAISPAAQYPSIIFAEQTLTLPLDHTDPTSLKGTLAQARSGGAAPLGSITHIIPTITSTATDGTTHTSIATLSQFFTALGLHPPDGLLRGLGDDFFFGVHTVDTNAPVFVIPVTSYDLAFSGMLAWEPHMNQELSPVFTSVPALIAGPDGLPTARTFLDTLMLNYDVRALKDDNGNIVLYYSFPTPKILIIAENPHTFTEILSRLQAQRQL